MKASENRPAPSALLEAFVSSNRSEKAFETLVQNLSGLVYSGAYRRTQNRQSAEEVSQNVFAILARKAESLRRHPCLTAWLHETIRLEAGRVIRTEKRRHRKLTALANETNSQEAMSSYHTDLDATWRDAIPILDDALDRLSQRDRQALYQRFYEGKKFHEMATQNGLSEAACKMRVRRALERVSQFLAGRGVTLSATVLASALGTEFARSAPAHAVSSMTSSALGASASIPTTTIIANTIQTMSTAKTTTIAASAVLALAAIPFSYQHAEGSRMRTELKTLETPADGSGQERRERLTALPRAEIGEQPNSADPNTPTEMLDWLDNPVPPRAWLKSLMEVAAGSDTLAIRLMWAQVEEMSPEEHQALIEELQHFPCTPISRTSFRDILSRFGPELPPRDRLEQMLADGVEGLGFSGVMSDWVVAEPSEALAWYQEKRASNEIFGEGLASSLQKNLLDDLLSGLGKSRPGEALELYLTTPEEELSSNSRSEITRGLAEAMAESGNDAHLVTLLDDMDEGQRPEALQTVAARCGLSGNFAWGMALFDQYESDGERRLSTIDYMFESLGSSDLVSGGLDWVSNSMDATEAAAVIRRIATSNTIGPDGIRQWIESQPPGGARDHAHAGRVEWYIAQNRFPRALAEAANIQDPSLYGSVRESAGRSWLEYDEDAASQALPPDLLQQILNR